jgi:hypothetical protein
MVATTFMEFHKWAGCEEVGRVCITRQSAQGQFSKAALDFFKYDCVCVVGQAKNVHALQ